MAYNLINGGSGHQSLSGGAFGWADTDYTAISCWVRTTGASNGVICSLTHATDTGSNGYTLKLENYSGTNYVHWIATRNNTAYDLGRADAGLASWTQANTDWHHIVAIADRDADELKLWTDNGTVYTKSSVKHPSTEESSIRFGATGVFYDTLGGDIAEVSLWGVAVGTIDAGVRTALYKTTPERVRIPDMVAYWPMIRELEPVKGGVALTENNSPTVAAHVPLIR